MKYIFKKAGWLSYEVKTAYIKVCTDVVHLSFMLAVTANMKEM